MRRHYPGADLCNAWVWLIIPALGCAGCKKTPPPTPAKPPAAAESPAETPAAPKATPPIQPGPDEIGALPPGHPPISLTPSPALPERSTTLPPGHPPVTPGAGKTVLGPITLTVPQGWEPVPPIATPGLNIKPKAVFRLTRNEADLEPVMVRVTHFPVMRDLPDMVERNLERWFGQFTQPDGRATKEVAEVESFLAGPCNITLADISGTSGGQFPRENERMLGAIIEHPKGPFFVVAKGSADSVGHWKASFVAYLRSVEPNNEQE